MAIQDDAKQFFLTELSRSQGDLPSLELEWLASEGYTRGSIDERWSYYLRDNGQPPAGVSWDLLGLTRNKGGGIAFTRTLSELPDPSYLSGETVKLVGPASTVYATSDGTTWTNARTGAEITPYWLPLDAKLHVDFDAGHYYWNGAERVLGDLTVVVAGGYELNYGFDFAGEAIVILEYEASALPANTANTLFSWTTGYPSGNRVEYVKSGNATYGDGIRVYISPGNPSADFDPLSVGGSKIGEGGAVWTGTERQRIVHRIKSNTANKFKNNDGQIKTGLKTPGTLATPTKLGFGNRAWAPSTNDNQFTGGSLKRVTIYNSDASDTVFHAMGRSGPYHPVHLLGDSFLNNYDVLQQVRKRFTDAGVYISTSQDGVGGTTSTQQAVRYTTTYPEWQGSTLVWAEMGLDGVVADWQAAFASIRAAMPHDRFLVVEPAPNVNDGTPQRDTWDAFVEDIRTACGGNVASGGNFVPTLEAAMALSTGSSEDLAKVAARRWPTSLTVSDTDFHPNHTAGAPFLAGQIYDALVLKGWAE